MNYLAHAYLSFNNPGILAGNMISDYVKGKKQYDYPPTIQQGIKLHRNIDEFTDNHAATHELKSFFRPHYRLYSGAFADVVYDHFLANDKNEFKSDAMLKQFSASTYQMLEPHSALFPLPFQKMFPYMKSQDWLGNYGHIQAIKKSFGGLVRRATYLTESDVAFALFNKFYTGMQDCYTVFFPDVKYFTIGKLEEILNN